MFCRAALIILLGLLSCLAAEFAQADDIFFPVPTHLKTIKSQSIQKIFAPSKKLLSIPQNSVKNSAQKNNTNYRFTLDLSQASIDIGINEVTHNKRGTRSFLSSFKANTKDWTLMYTQGNNSGFGELFGNGQHLLIEQRGEEVFVVDIGLSGLTPGIYENDVVGELKAFQT